MWIGPFVFQNSKGGVNACRMLQGQNSFLFKRHSVVCRQVNSLAIVSEHMNYQDKTKTSSPWRSPPNRLPGWLYCPCLSVSSTIWSRLCRTASTAHRLCHLVLYNGGDSRADRLENGEAMWPKEMAGIVRTSFCLQKLLWSFTRESSAD